MRKNKAISVSIITTNTIHHTYFVKKISEKYEKLKVFVEEKILAPSFSTPHPYERERDIFELNSWFGGKRHNLTSYAECNYFENINIASAKKMMLEYNADVNIVFGTSKISDDMCLRLNKRLLNLHGGNPERYRGLDSHLWSLYHQDKSGLVTTLHEINPKLDDGNIINIQELDYSKILNLSHLRKENTETCVELVLDFLELYSINGSFVSKKQTSIGRYYSHMPTVLKEVVADNFKKGKYDKIFGNVT